jgi:hypothetical protein
MVTLPSLYRSRVCNRRADCLAQRTKGKWAGSGQKDKIDWREIIAIVDRAKFNLQACGCRPVHQILQQAWKDLNIKSKI